jgi:cell division protein FtsB
MLKFKSLFRGVLFCASLLIGIGIVRSVYTISQKHGIITERQKILTELTAKNTRLQDDLREATSAAFIEAAARDKLGLVREGETVVIMDTSHITSINDQKNPQELPPWKQWWSLFF